MSDLFQQLKQHLAKKQIGHWSNAEEKAVCVDFPGIVGFYRVFARVNSDRGPTPRLGSGASCSPERMQFRGSELLELANLQERIGELELNEEANELRFHTAENLTDDELSGEMIDRAINVARNGVDTYLRAILCVMFGNEQPADALWHALPQSGAQKPTLFVLGVCRISHATLKSKTKFDSWRGHY